MSTIPALYEIQAMIFDRFTVVLRLTTFVTSIKPNFWTVGRITKCLTIIWGRTKNATQWAPSQPSTTYRRWFSIVLRSFYDLRPLKLQSNLTFEPLVRFQSVLPLFGGEREMLRNEHHPSPLRHTDDDFRLFYGRFTTYDSWNFNPSAWCQTWRQKTNKKRSFLNNRGVGYCPLSCFSRGTPFWCKTLRNLTNGSKVRFDWSFKGHKS